MLVHEALADPTYLIASARRRGGLMMPMQEAFCADILPEEIPLQQALERAIHGALREGCHAQDVARNLRFLCKQGAPLSALEEVLQSALIVYISPVMRSALAHMFYSLPKWIECAEARALQ